MIPGFSLSFDIKSFTDGNCLSKDSKNFKASICFSPFLSLFLFAVLKLFQNTNK